MKVNKALYEATGDFDSGWIGVHVDIVHPLSEEGLYTLEVERADGEARRLVISVNNDAREDALHLVLGELFDPFARDRRDSVKPGGYVVFDAGFSGGAYRVRLTLEERVILDSTGAGAPCLIAVSPLVPGEYELEDDGTGAKARFAVTVLEEEADEKAMVAAYQKLREDGPVQVALTGSGFEPDQFTLVADQPFVVQAFEKTRLIGRRSGAETEKPRRPERPRRGGSGGPRKAPRRRAG